MKIRQYRKPYLFYPEDLFIVNWELFITLILLYTCAATPIRIAFVHEDTLYWSIQKWLVDALFFLDICIIFNTAYQDDDFITRDDRKDIAIKYLSGWFTLDILSIAPFDLISLRSEDTSIDNLNTIVRLTKIGRITKMIKLTKLLRILKIVKQ